MIAFLFQTNYSCTMCGATVVIGIREVKPRRDYPDDLPDEFRYMKQK